MVNNSYMHSFKQRSFKLSDKNRQNFGEEHAMSKLSSDLKACDQSANEIVCVFDYHLHLFNKNSHSIKNIVKLGLSSRYSKFFTEATNEKHTRNIIRLIHDDINKSRNQKSNPSIFFKFLGINNPINLTTDDVQSLIDIALEKLNLYISCDKNVLFLMLKVLKSKMNYLKQQSKKALFDKLLNSYLLYFTELQKEKLRKDYEIIKNFISHFKILALLLPFKFFEALEYKK